MVGAVVHGLVVAVAVYHATTVVYLPPVVSGSGSMAHYAVVVGVHPGLEAHGVVKTLNPFLRAVWHGQVFPISVYGDHLLTLVEVYLALEISVVSRNPPPCLYLYGRQGEAPPLAQPARSAPAAVLHRQRRLHALAPVGDVYRIAHLGVAALDGGGHSGKDDTFHGVGGFEIAHHGGDICFDIGHLGGLEKLVDEVGEMGGERHHLTPLCVHRHTLKPYPCLSVAVVV